MHCKLLESENSRMKVRRPLTQDFSQQSSQERSEYEIKQEEKTDTLNAQLASVQREFSKQSKEYQMQVSTLLE